MKLSDPESESDRWLTRQEDSQQEVQVRELQLTAGEATERATEAANRLASEVIRLNGRYVPEAGVIPGESNEQLVQHLASVIISVMADRYLIAPENGPVE